MRCRNMIGGEKRVSSFFVMFFAHVIVCLDYVFGGSKPLFHITWPY